MFIKHVINHRTFFIPAPIGKSADGCIGFQHVWIKQILARMYLDVSGLTNTGTTAAVSDLCAPTAKLSMLDGYTHLRLRRLSSRSTSDPGVNWRGSRS